jgi:hypothetical protein
VSKDKVATLEFLMAREAGFEYCLVRRLTVLIKLSEPPAAGRGVFFSVFDNKLNIRDWPGNERLGAAKDFVVFL